jgi:hypothetical protein
MNIKYNPSFRLNLEFNKTIKINFETNSNNEDSLSFETTKFGWGGGTVLPENFEAIKLCKLYLNLKEELSDNPNDFKFGSCHFNDSNSLNAWAPKEERLPPDEFIIILNLEKKNFSWLKDSYFKEGNNYISELKIDIYSTIIKHPTLNAFHEVTSYNFRHNSN